MYDDDDDNDDDDDDDFCMIIIAGVCSCRCLQCLFLYIFAVGLSLLLAVLWWTPVGRSVLVLKKLAFVLLMRCGVDAAVPILGANAVALRMLGRCPQDSCILETFDGFQSTILGSYATSTSAPCDVPTHPP